jgi:DNA-binding MarR family transcriptional regulator
MSPTAGTGGPTGDPTRHELANHVYFRLYQCANMMHKTGTRAVESEGLTTQRWAVLGALSRPEIEHGMAVGDLARYLKVSRQSLSGIIRRLEHDGLVESHPDPSDGRGRLLHITDVGRTRWHTNALPLINDYYDQAVAGLSVEDLSHALHYLVRLLDNMTAMDQRAG